MAEETVRVEMRERVALLTLWRPERKNAFNARQWRELADALEAVKADDAVACAVVTGAGGAFSAGQDLSEFGDAGAAGEVSVAFPRFMETLLAFDKPLVAAVNGVGVGIGATLPLHCDVVYMAESARLRFPFSVLGLVPEAASSLLLPQLVGAQRAAEIFYTSEWIDAARALELGLAARVLPDAELLDAALARAAEIAARPLGALRAIKRLLLATRGEAVRATLEREMQAMREQVGTAENLEALRDFFARRPAR